MKAQDFIRVLKKVIKEEVRSVIREEIKTALTPVLLEQHRSKNKLKQSKPMPLPKQKPQKDFGIGIDGPLGDILRETANDLRNGRSAPIQESSANEWGDMGHYDAADAMGFGQMHDDDFQVPAQFGNDPTAAFVKDYSAVLQSSYEKSGMQ